MFLSAGTAKKIASAAQKRKREESAANASLIASKANSSSKASTAAKKAAPVEVSRNTTKNTPKREAKKGENREGEGEEEEEAPTQQEGWKDKAAPRNATLVPQAKNAPASKNAQKRGLPAHEKATAIALNSEVKVVQFGIHSPDEIRAMGVVSITNHRLYEKHQPAKNGLFDLRMGPPNREFLCETCKMEFKDCPGHFGYIELAVPVYHPLTMTTVCKVLNCVCFNCSSLLVAKTDAFLRKIRSIRNGRARLNYIFESLKKKPMRTCGVCQAESKPTIALPGDDTTIVKEGGGKKMRFFMQAEDAHCGSRSLWQAPLWTADGGVSAPSIKSSGENASKTVDSKTAENALKTPAFIVQAQPNVANRHPEKDGDALVGERGCLSIQPKIVQEGPKLLAVWPDLAKLYGFLVHGETEEEENDEDDDEEDDDEDDEEKEQDEEEEEESKDNAEKRFGNDKRRKRAKKTDSEASEQDGDDNGKSNKKSSEKRKVKKASEATQSDVAALLRRSPYTLHESAKPGNRETFGAARAHQVLKCMSDEGKSVFLSFLRQIHQVSYLLDVWLLGFDPEHSHPAWMVLTVLPVLPPCCRPPITLPNAKKLLIQDHLTIKLLDIVKKNNTLHKQLHFNHKDWHDNYGLLLQWHVATYIDNTDKSRPTAKLDSGKPMGCLIERWKGKRGRLRGNLMGKRVQDSFFLFFCFFFRFFLYIRFVATYFTLFRCV